MGDRISIRFHKKDPWGTGKPWYSATLYYHWAGEDVGHEAAKAVRQRLEEFPTGFQGNVSTPSTRLDPDAFAIEFALEHQPDRIVPTPLDCDNSDNGHWDIDCETGETTITSWEDLRRTPPPQEDSP